MLCSSSMLHRACVHTTRDRGRLGVSVPCSVAHESHSLGCLFSQLAEFQREICTLNKNLLHWTFGLALEGYWSCLFSSSRVTDPVISTVEKVIWDGTLLLPNSVSHGEQDACYPEIPGPVKAEKEQSSPSLQNTQRNIYSTFASNAAKAQKKRDTWREDRKCRKQTKCQDKKREMRFLKTTSIFCTMLKAPLTGHSLLG